jgi:hypothetical protein
MKSKLAWIWLWSLALGVTVAVVYTAPWPVLIALAAVFMTFWALTEIR